MPADKLLATLLRALQTLADEQDTSRLFGTGVSLLTTLNNPLNITLLTSQLLCAPAIWTHSDGLRTCLNFMGVFHTAAVRLAQREREVAERKPDSRRLLPQQEATLSLEEWARAVIKGADERSPRSRHLLVLGGLLIGFGGQDEKSPPRSIRNRLEAAFVTAANLAMLDPTADELSRLSVVFAVNYAFPHLPDHERSKLEYDLLLPVLMHAMLHSADGLRSGYFLGAVDGDIQQVTARQFNWSASSPSFHQLQAITSGPLMTSLGPLSRLIAHTVEQVRNSWLITSVVEDIAEFSSTLLSQWRQNKLCEIDASEEGEFLHEEARNQTLPVLWKLMRSTLFALVIVLRSAVGRVLGDGALASDAVAPRIAQQSLRTLRSLTFIFSRLGSAAFSQYTMTYLTTIDILSMFPTEADAFLRSIAPKQTGQIPAHPLERQLDLFFLNIAEHFTLALPPSTNEGLLITSATPYLQTGGNPHLLPIFEAAHSVMLAVFSAPQNVEVTSKHLPFYFDALFKVFPDNLSPRQFRLAFKNLVRIVSPPSAIASAQPLLAATLLDLVHDRALRAPTLPLLGDPAPPTGPQRDMAEVALGNAAPMSEQAVLVLTLIDALPHISLNLLEEWLPLTAAIVDRVPDAQMRETCTQHLWDVIVSAEMDAERSQTCVACWTTRGGRDALVAGRALYVHTSKEVVMSGALPDETVVAKL